jgi:acyl-CoA-dependent ceramide synthase
MRHYLNLRIIWSEFNEFKTVGPYELDWATEQYKCWISHYISTALLASLQALNIFWLFFILRIAYRYVFFQDLEDDRSDNDENEFAEEQRLDAARAAMEETEDDDAKPAPATLHARPNGRASAGEGTSSSAQVRTNGSTNRKEGLRKA